MRNFPWQLFRKFLARSLVVFLPVLGIAIGILRYGYFPGLEAQFPNHDWTYLKSDFLMLIVASLVCLYFGLIVFALLEWMLPLGAVIKKVKAIEENKYELDVDEDSLAQEEPGEWSDIELAIGHIGQSLKNSIDQVTDDKNKLQDLLNAISDPIFAVNKDNIVLFYNNAFHSMVGLPISNRMRLAELLRWPELENIISQAKNRSTIIKNEIRHSDKATGLEKVFQITAYPLKYDKLKNEIGSIVVFHDITEIKKLESIRIDFVANVSHELKTPLTSIQGYAQTLHDDIKQSRYDLAEKCISVIRGNTQRLLDLVNDLLNISSLESGVALNYENVNVYNLTKMTVENLDLYRVKKNIKIEINGDATLLRCDSKRIDQVLHNLIQNAIQYSQADSKIVINWTKEGDSTVLSVQDFGSGIAPEHHPRLFERFYRVDKSRQRESGGTGLGLAIVKHIVLRHGGSVGVKSLLGQGSIFYCRFPNHEVPQ